MTDVISTRFAVMMRLLLAQVVIHSPPYVIRKNCFMLMTLCRWRNELCWTNIELYVCVPIHRWTRCDQLKATATTNIGATDTQIDEWRIRLDLENSIWKICANWMADRLEWRLSQFRALIDARKKRNFTSKRSNGIKKNIEVNLHIHSHSPPFSTAQCDVNAKW